MNGNKRLIEKIKKVIQRRGAIPFFAFMEMALYDAEEGYYMVSSQQFGKGGDFATSLDFHPLFGKMIAKQLAQMLKGFPQGTALTLVEMGAGKGTLCELILESLREDFPKLFDALTYKILERSPGLRDFQYRRLQNFEKMGKVAWGESFSDLGGSLSGCLFSNELLDSFPVHRVERVEGKLKEVFVSLEGDELNETLDDPSTPALSDYFKALKIDLAEGVMAEVNLKALDWMRAVGNCLASGYVLTVDYGYPAKQLYTPARPRGTLMCYYRHQVNEDPYERIGLQDITSHVDFSSLASEGRKVGLEVLGFTDQLSFLMGLGVAHEMEKMIDEKGPDHLEVKRAKALLMPDRMGKVFKVLVQGKKISPQELDGLAFRPFISGVLDG